MRSSQTLIFSIISALLAAAPFAEVRAESGTVNSALRAASSRNGSSAVRSLLNFNPEQAQFAKALDPVVQPITRALKILAAEGEPLENTVRTVSKAVRIHFETALRAAQSMEENGNRGLQDELAFLKGFAYEELGENEKALESYNKSLKLRAGNPIVMFRQGLVLKKLNRCNEALPKFTEVGWLTSDYEPEVLFTSAQCLDLLQRGGEATSLLEQIKKKHPEYRPAARLLLERHMVNFDASGKRLDRNFAAKLEKDLTNLAAENPGDSDTSLMLAKVLVKKSDPLVSLDDIQKGQAIAQKLAERSDFQNDGAVRVVFDAQLKQGDLASAERTVTRGLNKKPDSKLLLDAARQLEILKEGQI